MLSIVESQPVGKVASLRFVPIDCLCTGHGEPGLLRSNVWLVNRAVETDMRTFLLAWMIVAAPAVCFGHGGYPKSYTREQHETAKKQRKMQEYFQAAKEVIDISMKARQRDPQAKYTSGDFDQFKKCYDRGEIDHSLLSPNLIKVLEDPNRYVPPKRKK